MIRLKAEDYEDIIRRYETAIADKDDSIAESLPTLSKHYRNIPASSPLEVLRKYYAVLAVLRSKNLDEARDNIRLTIDYGDGIKLALTALTEAPDDWKDLNEDLLQQKGIIRGHKRFHDLAGFDAKEGNFMKLGQKIAPEFRHLFLIAVDCSRTHSNMYRWKPQERALCYTAVQLWNDGPEKTAKIKSFRETHNASVVNDLLASTAKGILSIAHHLHMAEEKLPTLNRGDLPLARKPAEKVRDDAIITQLQKTPADLANERLLEEFNKGAKLTQMKDLEKEICLYMIKPDGQGSFNLRPAMEVHTKFNAAQGKKIDFELIYDLQKKIPKVIQLAKNPPVPAPSPTPSP